MKTHSIRSALSGWWSVYLTFAIGLSFAGCQQQSRGFALPEGDISKGKQAFLDLSCNRCHSIGDIKWLGREDLDDPHIELGGEVTTLMTYGKLVTSVINPSHEISRKYIDDKSAMIEEDRSKMEIYRYNEIMTVEELVNLVSFLQSEYKVVRPENTYPYPIH